MFIILKLTASLGVVGFLLNELKKACPKTIYLMEFKVFKYIWLFLMPTVSWSMYDSQTLTEQINQADFVFHVQIIQGQIHQFEQVYSDSRNPSKKHIMQERCGYSYSALVLESFKGSLRDPKVVEFASIESFAIGAEKLLFLSQNQNSLLTDVITVVDSVDYNRKLNACKKDLPQLYSMHLSTADFMDYNSWIQVSHYEQLPEDIYQSPHLSLKAEGFENKTLGWNKAPSQDRMYGRYARWYDLRKYIKNLNVEN